MKRDKKKIWNKEHQALWYIFQSTIRAFKISDLITVKEEEEIINKLQEIIKRHNPQ